jgi:lysophospholipase L1-like esterase
MFAALGLLWVGIVLYELSDIMRRRIFAHFGSATLCVSTLFVFSLAFEHETYQLRFVENAAIISLGALAIWISSRRIVDAERRQQWKSGALIWAFLGTAIGLTGSYLENRRGIFYLGLLMTLTLLILFKRWFRLSVIAVQVVNTLLLVVIGIPTSNLVFARDDQLDVVPALEQEPYSYQFARKNPAAFARWWRHYNEECSRFLTELRGREGGKIIDSRSNNVVTYHECRIPINNKGFRGRDIPDERGDTYRIVALGESTTFGMTMKQEDRPWPERLEIMIRERLKPRRPVHVINAGTPGFSIRENLQCLSNRILPLQPQMILSYHGANGFKFIYEGMPPVEGKKPPRYRQRPLTLLADFEYRFKVRNYRSQLLPKTSFEPAFLSSPLESDYARFYRQLIQFARTNDIHLVMATYSMAVNSQSPHDVLEFHRMIGSEVDRQIIANAAHSTIVRQLVKENPHVCLVDTCPLLDGQHEHYLDLVHFNEKGEEKMAELFFAGVRQILDTDLKTAHPESTEASNRSQ